MTLLTIIHTLHMFNRHQNTVTHTLGSCDNIYMLKWDCLNNDMYVIIYSIDIYSNSLKTKVKKNTSTTTNTTAATKVTHTFGSCNNIHVLNDVVSR